MKLPSRILEIKKMVMAMTLVIAICCLGKAQPLKREFAGYDQHFVIPQCHTYDNAILYSTHTYGYIYGSVRDTLQYIIKATLDGQEIWRIQLNGISPSLSQLHATRDSGFILAGAIDLHSTFRAENDSASDSSVKVAIVKFDKCGKMEWSTTLDNDSVNWLHGSFVNEKNDIYLLVFGINGNTNDKLKTYSLLRFSQHGALEKYYHGNSNNIFIHNNYDQILTSAMVYFKADHLDSNSLVFACTNVKSFDLDLNLQKSAIFGFKERTPNHTTSLIITDQTIFQASRGLEDFGKVTFKAMFRKLNRDLIQPTQTTIETEFDDLRQLSDATLSLDKMLYWGVMRGGLKLFDPFYPSIRCYDENLNLVRTISFPDTGYTISTFFPLKDSSAFITVLYNESTAKSIHYLVDKDLNMIPWPKADSGAVYDYACTGGAPAQRIIDVTKLNYNMVRVPTDNTPEDWSWVYTTGIDEDGVIEQNMKAEMGKEVLYPNPAENVLHIQLPKQMNAVNYRICAMDGRVEASGQLTNGASTNGIDISLLKKGMHIIHIQNESESTVLKFIRQ